MVKQANVTQEFVDSAIHTLSAMLCDYTHSPSFQQKIRSAIHALCYVMECSNEIDDSAQYFGITSRALEVETIVATLRKIATIVIDSMDKVAIRALITGCE